MDARRILLELFDAALRAVDGQVCVERELRARPPDRAVAVFAIGKAASAMTRGAQAALGDSIQSLFLVTKDGHLDSALGRAPDALLLETAHPVPDARSVAAGAALEARIAALPASLLPLFLVSGGSSSLVEAPRAGVTLEDLRSLNETGLAGGWDIARLNQQRARLSRLKGGGVARLLEGRRALALFLSDVPGDDPGVIGSGLLGRDGGQADSIERRIVANVETAVAAVREAAAARGLGFDASAGRFAGEAAGVAREFVAALRNSVADGLVWGGESTVTLPGTHGRGGRNTHLALAAAHELRANDPYVVLAAGTDGTDGPTGDAGAIVDAGTIRRGELAGCDVARALREFDSGTALEAAEDLVHTGPTGTNVGDILIGIKQLRGFPRGYRADRML